MAKEVPKDDTRYIIECIYRGRYAKVSAVDPVTGTEVSIVGDAMRTKKELERVAVQKLEYVLAKNLERPSKGGFKV